MTQALNWNASIVLSLHMNFSIKNIVGVQRVYQKLGEMLCLQTFFQTNSVFTNDVLSAQVHV